MYVKIMPDSNELQLILEAQSYRDIWSTQKQQIINGFIIVVGLKFQQKQITARVIKGNSSSAGNSRRAMYLAGDYRTKEQKLFTLVHELTHRLLNGLGLGLNALGLLRATDYNESLATEIDHRHCYLISYEVIKISYGPDLVEQYMRYEDPDSSVDDPHRRAWRWVLSLTEDERSARIRLISSYAVTRNDRQTLEKRHIPYTETLAGWMEHLNNPTV